MRQRLRPIIHSIPIASEHADVFGQLRKAARPASETFWKIRRIRSKQWIAGHRESSVEQSLWANALID
jgi:hypothetical protein